MVGPLTLALEAGCDSVVTECFFAKTHLNEARIPDHYVTRDHRHLHTELPFFVPSLAAALLLRMIGVHALRAVLADPYVRAREFLLIVNAPLHATNDLNHVHLDDAHAQVRLEERTIDDGAGDAHGGAAHGAIAFVAHGGDRKTRPGKLEQLLLNVVGNCRVAAILDIPSIDIEDGVPLLIVSSRDRCAIDRTWPLCPVETPDRFWQYRIHVHRFGAITPTRRDSNGDADALACELLRAHRGFRNATDAAVGKDTLHLRAVGVAQLLGNQSGHALGHVHGLLLKRLAHAAETAVDCRSNANPGVLTHQSVLRTAHLQDSCRWHGYFLLNVWIPVGFV